MAVKPAGSSNNQLHKWATKIAALVGVIAPGSVTNAMLANMASPRVKARGTAGSGAPEDIAIGNGVTLDATSLRTVQQMSVTVDGSGLKLSGDATSPGNSKYYGTDSGGTKGFNSLPAGGGITLISSVAAPAAATWTVTGLGGYKMLWMSCRDISQASGTSRVFQVELSGNGGGSFGGIKVPTGGTSFVSGNTEVMNFFVSRADQTNNQLIFIGTFVANTGSQIDTGSVGPIDSMRFSWSGAATNFTGGTIDFYGIK